jgi:predicted enzyme related to lactoylglutathione lyase
MSNDAVPVGQIGWVDLTIPDAEKVRDFYADVTGWTPAPVPMGDYQDYCMTASDGQTVAGVCHARGENAALPAAWMIYIVVADLEESIRRCQARGGKLLSAVRCVGEAKFCIIQDPAGAVSALYQAKAPGA